MAFRPATRRNMGIAEHKDGDGDAWDTAHSTSQRPDMSTLFGSATSAASSASATQGDISKDIAVTSPPDDSISGLSFCPNNDYLAVSSWDKKVRIYEVQQSGATVGKAQFEHEGPVLSCAWSKVSLSTSPSGMTR